MGRGITSMAKLSEERLRIKRADGRDQEIGRRVRCRRLECRLTQSELANQIGVTFQQVRKYEKAINRIDAVRLQQISEALAVPVSFFVDVTTGDKGHETSRDSDSVFHLMQAPGSVQIVTAFHKIKSRSARKALIAMAEELAGQASKKR
jgi:transcriptional regulator with XRE-family HTH domain